jgi:hypothetical protein
MQRLLADVLRWIEQRKTFKIESKVYNQIAA